MIVEEIDDGTERLSGTITCANEDGARFLVGTQDLVWALTGVIVETDDQTRHFTVTVNDIMVTSSDGAGIEPGDVVEVYGSCQSHGGFAAESAIKIDDQCELLLIG